MDEALKKLIAQGRAYFEKRQYAEAEQCLAQVVEQNQTFADVYNMLGVALHDGGHFARAQKAFEKALSINPAYTEAKMNLAVIYNDLGQYAEAMAIYQSMSRTRTEPGELDPTLKNKLANMYAEIGDALVCDMHWRKAVEEYRRALELGPTFADVRLKLASALREMGEWTAALKEYDRVLEQNPDLVAALVGKGFVQQVLMQKEQAIATWEMALQKQPGHKGAELYLNLARKGTA